MKRKRTAVKLTESEKWKLCLAPLVYIAGGAVAMAMDLPWLVLIFGSAGLGAAATHLYAEKYL